MVETMEQQPNASSASEKHAVGRTEAAATTLQNKAKLLIIGAGISGLSAANHLMQNGYDNFLILEARNRIGGRIVSIPLGTQKIELGANWIHGVLGNPIFEIAVKHGLVSVLNVPKPHRVIATTEDGKQVPFSILQEIYEAYVCFLRRCDEYFLCQYIPPPDINSVGEHVNYEIEIYLSSVRDPKEKRLKQLLFNCLLKRETCITGCTNMNEIDLLELGSYTELQGGNFVLPSGYSSILQPLSEHIPKDRIITKCAVKRIYWKRKKTSSGLNTVEENSENEDSDDSQKTVTNCATKNKSASADDAEAHKDSINCFESVCKNPKDHKSVVVTCEDGRVFYADHVLCTLPLGVLKRSHKTLFDPQLPLYKQESVERLLYGCVDKIFLEYERPFLSADVSEILLLWDDDKNMLQESSEENAEEYLCKNWYKKIYSFAKLSDTLLLGWVSGREAEYMETLSDEAISEKCTEILRKFLRDPYVPKPKRCLCTSWMSQPFTCGSYTSIPVGASQEDIENLAHPLYSSPQKIKPSVLFAGEHTHSNFYSTVHGAYLSGRTAAQQLLAVDEPKEIIMEPDETDLSAWIQGIALE